MNIVKTLNTIAQCSQPSSGVTRLPFTKEHKQANKIITQWMKDAGMQVHLDAAGTLIGTYKSSNKNAKTLILGSHQDSVINAGRFDGIMGVLLPLLAVKKLHQKKTKNFLFISSVWPLPMRKEFVFPQLSWDLKY